MLKNAEHPEGGGSLDAICGWERTAVKKVYNNPDKCVWILHYLLKRVDCCRVGSQGEGKLQHVHLDGTEQGTGFLHNQVIVGLICVCMRIIMYEHCHASVFPLIHVVALLSVLSYYSFTCSRVINSAAFLSNMKATLCYEWLQQVTLPSCSPSIFSLASTNSQNISWLSSARNSLRNKRRKVAVSWAFMLPVHNERWMRLRMVFILFPFVSTQCGPLETLRIH